jgi:hypothetical protein
MSLRLPSAKDIVLGGIVPPIADFFNRFSLGSVAGGVFVYKQFQPGELTALSPRLPIPVEHYWWVASKRVLFDTTLLSPPANDKPNEPADIALRIFNPLILLFLSRLSCSHFRNCGQGQHTQEHPAFSKELVTGSCTSHCPHFSNICIGCLVRLLHSSQTFFHLRKGVAAPLNSRVSASLRSNPPLSLRIGHALDFFHLAGNRAIMGLSPKAALSIFLF